MQGGSIMKKRCIGLSLIMFTIAGVWMTSMVWAAETVHWGYSGHEGPEYWGELDPSFSLCATGKNQSPVNLTDMIDGNLPPITVNYQAGRSEIVNNGHTIQLQCRPGSTITVQGKEYALRQLHFHSPSENTIEGHSYPMEAHFVHADTAGNLAVIAVMFKEGAQDTELEKAWAYMPRNAGETKMIPQLIDVNLLLPQNHDYYRFNGSLTTPPCLEGVTWFVMKYYVTASREQINKFSTTMNQATNRPVQPVNARVIIK
jgi:carbonic anhydrase